MYIVYAYTPCASLTPTKYILGVYASERDAMYRQRDWVDAYPRSVAFINAIPPGDCYEQLFTGNVYRPLGYGYSPPSPP